MQLSDNTVKILDGKINLVKRNRSSKWYAHYIIGSEQRRLSTGESDLQKAKVKATDMYHRAKFRDEEGLPPVSKKFAAVAKLVKTKMQDAIDAGHGRRIYETYITAIDKYLVPYYGNHNIDRIDMKLIKGFEAFRLTVNKNKIMASTQKTYNAAMSHIFDEALQRGYMTQGQVPMLETNAVTGDRRPDFTLDEYHQLVSYMDSWITQGQGRGPSKDKVPLMRTLLRDYVIVLANTGMRPGEESNRLRWNQLRWITRDGKRLLYLAVTSKKGKGGKAKVREPIVKPAGIEALKRIHAAATDLKHLSFEQLTKQLSDQYVFRLADGTRTLNLGQTFDQLMIDSGLQVDPRTGQNRTLYSLRHTYATISVGDGVSYEFLQVQMGTSMAMLHLHYDHLSTQHAGVGIQLSHPLGTSSTSHTAPVVMGHATIDPNVLAIAATDFGKREVAVDKDGKLRLTETKGK